MPINLTSNLLPLGAFPLVEDNYLKGGYQSVANNTARDAINTQSRKEGMLVFVRATSIMYKLGVGLTNGDWLEFGTASNLGSGLGLYASKSDSDLRFKSLIAGTNISLTPTGTDITISAAGALTGPGSSTDKAISTWNGTGGTALNNSVLKINPAGTLTSSTALTITTDDAASGLGISIYPGDSTSSNNNGADTIIYAGTPHGTGTPGEILLRGADKVSGSIGGNIRLLSGDGISASTDGVIRIEKTSTGGRATRLQFVADDGDTVAIKAPAAIGTSYELLLPTDQGASDTVLRNNGSGALSWVTKGLTVPALSGVRFAVLMENPIGTLVWQLMPQVGVTPTFEIISFAKTAPNGNTLLYRRGDEITEDITVSATYISGPPQTAEVTHVFGGSTNINDTDPPSTWDTMISPFTTALLDLTTGPDPLLRNGSDLGADPTMTITLEATDVNSTTDTSSIIIQWTRDVYYGVGAAGINTESGIEALAGTNLAINRFRNIIVSPSNQKVYYAYPKSYGAATFTLDGFPAAFNTVIEVSLTNVNSITSTYFVYESEQLLTGTNLNFVVT